MLRACGGVWQWEQHIACWAMGWLAIVIWMEQRISVRAMGWLAVSASREQRLITDGILGWLAIGASREQRLYAASGMALTVASRE